MYPKRSRNATASAALGLFDLASGAAALTVSAVVFALSAWSVPAIVAAMCGDLVSPRLAGLLADRSGTFDSAYVFTSV